MDKRRVMGTREKRIDGIAKSTGSAKYNSDVKPQGTLFAVLVTSPYAHARVKSVDTSAADGLKGVTATYVITGAGKEVQWEGQEVAAVAAATEELARDGARLIKVDYEVLPHLVREDDVSKAGDRAKVAGEQLTGDPDQAFKDADAVSEGTYGIPVITHCCLEPHGQSVAWNGDHVDFWPSTQNVSDIGGDLSKALGVPASNVHIQMEYVGGGFGSKFSHEVWGETAAQLSKKSGGKPVRLFLDRATELQIAGNRPSLFGQVKVGGKKDGTLTAWDSTTWSTGGLAGGGADAGNFPYVYRNVPNRRFNHTAISTNCGSARAWRAPNHPQASFITCSAFEDLAAKLNMDSLQFFLKNADYTSKPDLYRFQLQKAAELIEWSKYGHVRGQGDSGVVRRGLGIGVATWDGTGHGSQCRTTIHPDGAVEIELGSQDLGTGTRTIIAMVAAETFGLPVSGVRVKIGDSSYPRSGASGGSTTIGGVSSSTRKSSVNALQKLFEAVAPSLGTTPDQLEAADSRIQVKGNRIERHVLASGLQQAGHAKDFRDWRKRSAPRASGRAEHRPRVRRPDGRRFGGHRDRPRANEPHGGGAGLRAGHQSANRREPGAGRHDHELLRRAFGRTNHGPADRPHAERRHGILQAGRHRRHRRHYRPHGYPARKRQTRRHRSGRAAHHSRHRLNFQCGGQRHRRAGGHGAAHARPRARRARKGERVNADLRIRKSRNAAGGVHAAGP